MLPAFLSLMMFLLATWNTIERARKRDKGLLKPFNRISTIFFIVTYAFASFYFYSGIKKVQQAMYEPPKPGQTPLWTQMK
jgi:glucan phosphoethanolaminetransferase (alkaline phosphatase superfamily)